MAKAGGNVRRSTLSRRPSGAVFVEAKPLRNLLRTVPDLMGPVTPDALESLAPGLIFRRLEDGKLTCKLGRQGTLADPEVHAKLADEQEKLSAPQPPVVRAYYAQAAGSFLLFPLLEGDSSDVGLTELQQEFEGRAEVTLGGVQRANGTRMSLAAFVLNAIDFLHGQNDAGSDFVIAEAAFAQHVAAL
jgi:hypothetical protein